MNRHKLALLAILVWITAITAAMLTDITGLAGIRLDRAAWTCTDQGPRAEYPPDLPDWRKDWNACKQWSRK